jgi:hypothetical protein
MPTARPERAAHVDPSFGTGSKIRSELSEHAVGSVVVDKRNEEDAVAGSKTGRLERSVNVNVQLRIPWRDFKVVRQIIAVTDPWVVLRKLALVGAKSHAFKRLGDGGFHR